MAYTKTNWANDTTPDISATNLNKMEQGIEDGVKGAAAFLNLSPTIEGFDVANSEIGTVTANKAMNAAGNIVTLNGYYLLEATISQNKIYKITGTGDPFFVVKDSNTNILHVERANASPLIEDFIFVAPENSAKLFVNRNGGQPKVKEISYTYEMNQTLTDKLSEISKNSEDIETISEISVQGYSMQKYNIISSVYNNTAVKVNGTTTTLNGYVMLEGEVVEGHNYKITGTGDPFFVVLDENDTVLHCERASASYDTEDFDYITPTNAKKIRINRSAVAPVITDETKTYRFVEGEQIVTTDGNTYDIGNSAGFVTRVKVNDTNYNGAFNYISINYNNALFKDSVDDISPIYFQTMGFAGANHGYEYEHECVCTNNHGLTASDIGKTYTDGNSNVWVLLRIPSEKVFSMICYRSDRFTRINRSTASPASVNFNGTTISNYTASKKQIRPSIKNLITHKEIKEDCLVVSEKYDVYNIGTGIDFIKENVGSCNNNTFINQSEPIIQIQNCYKVFTSGVTVLYTSFKSLSTVYPLGYYAGTQVIKFASTDLIAALGTSIDDLTSGEQEFKKSTWTDQSKAPQVYIKTNSDKSKAFVVIFVEDRTSYLERKEAGKVENDYKLYPYMITANDSVPVGTVDSETIIRMPINKALSGADYISHVVVGNKVYMFVGILTARTETVALPEICVGKTMSVFETKDCSVDTGVVIASVDITSSGEGFIVLKFE